MKGDSLIQVFGLYGRTGTYFVRNLIGLHEAVAISPLKEDFMLEHAGMLTAYIDRLDERWPLYTERERQQNKAALRSRLANAMVAHIRGGERAARIVSRSPRINGLDQWRTWLPGAKVVVCIRDGRDVCESGLISFGWPMTDTARLWADAVRRLRDMRQLDAEINIVRFEDLIAKPEETVRGLLDVLRLDESGYDFEAMRKLPVVGSCETAINSGYLHWSPVEKSDQFAPVGRWSHWSASDRRIFRALAGDEMEAFGYDLSGF